MNKNQICEIVKDLLPLYTDNDCSESSKAMVEEHVKTCKDCKNLLDAMRCPLNVETPEKIKDVPVERALKKMHRKVWHRVLAILLVISLIVVVIPMGISTYHAVHNNGISFDNLDELKRVKMLLETWKQEGSESVADLLNSEIVYEDLTLEHYPIYYSEQKISEDFPYHREKYGAYNIYGTEADEFMELEIGDETYMITKSFYYNVIADDDDPEGFYQSYQNCKKTGNADEFWYQLIVNGAYTYIIPESLYTHLLEKYEDLSSKKISSTAVDEDGNKTYWPCGQPLVSVEADSGLYYYRYDSNYAMTMEIPRDMQEKTGCDTQPDELYLVLANMDIITPELYDYYQSRQNEIESWYKTYRRYYEDQGEVAFAREWIENVSASFAELEETWGTITDYRFSGSIYRYRQTSGTSSQYGEGWRSGWIVTFNNETEVWIDFYTPQFGKSLITGMNIQNEELITEKNDALIQKWIDSLKVVDKWPLW